MNRQNSSIRIRPMTDADAERVYEIFNECFTAEKWSLKSIREELQNPIAVTLVAADGNDVVGFINVHHILGEGDLNDIAVTAEYRRQNVGGLLLDAIRNCARNEGISCYTLEVRCSNTGAVAFYEKHGFYPVGRRKNYYTKPTEDGLLYRLDLV